MKKHVSILLFLLTYALAPLAQAQQVPQGMKYQAVARNLTGGVLANQPITLRITLNSKVGTATTTHYSETHDLTTNTLGLFDLTIGAGKARTGTFNKVPWSSQDIWMEVAIQEGASAGFATVSSSRLLAVPYAFHALTATQLASNPNARGGPTDGVPGNVWSTFGNTKTDPATDRMGTMDNVDLIFVTNKTERLRINKDGDVNITNSLKVGKDVEVGRDLTVKRDVFLNTTGGQTINNGPLTVTNAKSTVLTGTLNVNGATDLDNTLNVDGIATISNATQSTSKTNGALVVVGGVGIGKNLNVGGNQDVDGTLNVDGATTLKNTLIVDGATTLNSTLNVTGNTTIQGLTNSTNTTESTNTTTGALVIAGGVGIGKRINVGGAAQFNNTLGVDGAADFNSTLNADGATTLNNTLNVTGVTTLNNTLNANGQVTINANMDGNDSNFSSYSLRVQGGNQGVAIKLNAGTPDNSNNFVTFYNGSGNAVGRIEGETTLEAVTDPEYIFDNGILVAEGIKAGITVGTSFIPVVVAGIGASAGPCGACIAAAAADLVLATANLIGYNVFALENLGVTYQSGSADYAEWLERSNSAEKIGPGDIVAVNGGKISKNTGTAQQFMVISTKPAVLGNMPLAGQEGAYEKVAFMGQIPVKVRGIVLSGDYILPSDRNDGTGIAVSPKDIKPEQYKQIVGVAWSEALVEGTVTRINMAIGLNSNDLATLAIEQDKKIKGMESKFALLEQRLVALEGGKPSTPSAAMAGNAPAPTATATELNRYELMAKNMPAELSNDVMTSAIADLKSAYAKQGVSLDANPSLKRLFTDASFQAEVIRKSQATYKASYQSIVEKSRK